jgi:hypothetical protein
MQTNGASAWDLFIVDTDEDAAELPQSVCHFVAW